MATTPTQEGMTAAPPAIMVIFGAAGDLTKRKLVPALYHLCATGLLPERFAMVGVSREQMDTEHYRDLLQREAKKHLGEEFTEDLWNHLIERCYYLHGDFRDPDGYRRLADKLGELDQQCQTPGNYLFYLATPPSLFADITTQLTSVGLTREQDGRWRRVIIEKPFGRNLESARALNHKLHQILEESQIYRIDHYLGKETVQNIMAFRFTNGIIEPIWNHRYIDHVQITVAESLGVENRASYYEEAGALRDMVPNHLLAVLSIVAMEPPISFDADEVRGEQSKVLRAAQALTPEEVLTHTVRGQYGAGMLPTGERVPAYRDEPRIAPDSNTETYVALRMMIDSWRWAGVPFYLRTGKRLPGRFTEVVVEYRHAPSRLFRDSLVKRQNVEPNRMVLRIQPDEGISLGFNAKVPGQAPQLSAVEMDFNYSDHFGDKPSTGYETLIYDCMKGDATLFKRADTVEIAWALMEPILDVWNALPPRNFPNYAAGTWGPKEADELLARDGRKWKICKSCSE
ncbi:MAG: glucose-6-phosphate dehydrogenase [Nitrospira sp.]|nr:glucose-6-phosphate dehydrogenase [Nitrospira sp.]